ncbi:hypothetical protein N8783_05195, partial [Alphaproteobacteria bacterium]|nr:hypothetical protein [Alphaproteobacteria bacterium]
MMMTRVLLTFLVGLVLSGCQQTIQIANDTRICEKATYAGKWDMSYRNKHNVAEAKRRGLSCGVVVGLATQVASVKPNPLTGNFAVGISNYTNDELCMVATNRRGNKRFWITPNQSSLSFGSQIKFFKEAKSRGLSCGVGETSSSIQTASTPVPKAKPKVTSAALTAAEKEAERLRQELADLRTEKAKQQQTISSDTKLPTITIASASSNGPQGTVKGRVKDNTGIAEVRVDGQPVEVDKTGNFTANTYVPEGGVSVSIQAVDLAGLSSSMSVRIDRAAVQTAAFRFDRLNPIGRKVARNKDAVAIIVGVSDYKETTARAAYADSDATVFKDYAIEKLGVPRDRI